MAGQRSIGRVNGSIRLPCGKRIDDNVIFMLKPFDAAARQVNYYYDYSKISANSRLNPKLPTMPRWVHRYANNWATSKILYILDCSRSLSFPQRALRVICGCTTTNWCAQRRQHLNRSLRPPRLLYTHAVPLRPQHHP